MEPTEKMYPIRWDEKMLSTIVNDFNFVSFGKLGCCEQTAYCDWDKKRCFSTGFGRASGYYNGGWKTQVTKNLANKYKLMTVAPIYSCIAANGDNRHIPPPKYSRGKHFKVYNY